MLPPSPLPPTHTISSMAHQQAFSNGRGSVKLNVLLDSQTFIGTGAIVFPRARRDWRHFMCLKQNKLIDCGCAWSEHGWAWESSYAYSTRAGGAKQYIHEYNNNRKRCPALSRNVKRSNLFVAGSGIRHPTRPNQYVKNQAGHEVFIRSIPLPSPLSEVISPLYVCRWLCCIAVQ